MKNISKIYFLLLALFALALEAHAQDKLNQILQSFGQPSSKSVMVVCHRGDWRNAPENSLQAFENCIAMGADMVELDLKKTKDGVLVLMHDKLIDRTTNGKGKPETYTLDSLKTLQLKSGIGCKTRHRVPTFREAMLLCKGKIMVNVDKGYDYFEDVIKILEETGTTNQCIIKANLPYEEVRAKHGNLLDRVIFMPVVNLCKPGAENIIDSYIKHMSPKVFEVNFKTADTNTLKLIRKIQDSGAHVFVNTLWPELCGGHDDDRAVELHQPEESWGWVVRQGVKLIQTDRPAKLIEYLRTKGLHD
ncbi:glycerophosphodiester phosphodiesterase family protein [Hallella bergensis]|uniref:glycerophosphodiester phosphodiesterase family protein n=1 Tax=Hallella bergensis TaxID=242750 RepID=UPI0039907A79